MAKVRELVREVDGYEQTLSIDIFKWSGSAGWSPGWKVRISGYDGKSPMPSQFDLLDGGESAKACEPLFEATVAKYEAEGWSKKLTAEGEARIRARVAAERAVEQAREAAIAERLKDFPATDLDRQLASAIAKPDKVRELDLSARDGQKLTAVPASIKKLVALEVLRLDNNGLLSIPEELGACKELRELYVCGNELVEIPFRLWSLKNLAVVDARSNRLRSIRAKPKVAMRLEIAGNTLRPAVQDLLTRSTIGDFRKLAHVGVDTDCVFPIDLTYLGADYPGVKALPTASIALYGRAPTDEERATLKQLLPKARIDHFEKVVLEESPQNKHAPAAKQPATDEAPAKNSQGPKAAPARKPGKPHAEQTAHLNDLLKQAKKLKIDAASLKKHARPCIDITTSTPKKSASKVGASRLGGSPDMPSDTAWPEGSGGPMVFVGQLSLKELSPFDPTRLLPEEGFLSFFASSFDEGRVLYFDKDAKLVSRTQPSDAMFSALAGNPAPACALTLRGGMSLPVDIQDDEVDRDTWHDFTIVARRSDDDDAFHRVLGHTFGDVEGPPEDDLALFAVASDSHTGVEWGDYGVLYFMMGEAELHARKWETVEVVSTD